MMLTNQEPRPTAPLTPAQHNDEYSAYWTGPYSRKAVPCQLFAPSLKRWFPAEEGHARAFEGWGKGKDRTPRYANGSVVWDDPRLCGARPGMPPQQVAAILLLSASLKHCGASQLKEAFRKVE